MSIYLLHLDPKYRHAAHYVGFTPEQDVTRRVSEHLAGGAKASPLVKVALQAGSRVTIARTWTGEGATRTRERQIKNSRHVPKYCPLCREQKRNPQQPTLPL
jgi:predicted GIY-YIG superfamily endonuclease